MNTPEKAAIGSEIIHSQVIHPNGRQLPDSHGRLLHIDQI